MNSKINFLGSIGMLCAMLSSAQPYGYFRDVPLYGQYFYATTPRMQAIGNAATSLGGDIGASITNPAGLGFFSKSSIQIAPSFNFINAESEYFNNNANDSRFFMGFDFIGGVINNSKSDQNPSMYRGGSFSISFAKLASFQRNYSFEGFNSESSILDAWINDVNTSGQYAGYSEGAYYSYLLNNHNDYTLDSTGLLSPVIGADGVGSFILGTPYQKGRIKERGAQYALNFSWGGNYDDILYFGVGVNMHLMRYVRVREYSETNFQYEYQGETYIDDVIKGLYLKEDTLEFNGAGISGNIGLIFRPLDFVRIGVSYQTPVNYAISESSSYTLAPEYNNYWYVDDSEGSLDTIYLPNVESYLSDFYLSEYSFKTPSRIQGGISVNFGKYGLISADIERVNLSNSKMRTSEFSEGDDNDEIKDYYIASNNYRIGAELRLNPLYFRGGYQYYGNIYDEKSGIDQTQHIYSGGIGYRKNDFAVDAAYSVTSQKFTYSPYEIESIIPTANVQTENWRFTIGVTQYF